MTPTLRLLLVLGGLALKAQGQEAWRSVLYPADWTPGTREENGRFLHDFSYAGYHRGERPLPEAPANGSTRTVNAVEEFGADNTGSRDTTKEIQAALDATGAAGGGIVYLLPGVYRVAPAGGSATALWIRHSHLILRGAGRGETFLYNTTAAMRGKEIIRVGPPVTFSWTSLRTNTTNWLTRDHPDPALELSLRHTNGLEPGEWIVARSDSTNEFIAEHQMTNWWTPARQPGPVFLRQIVSIDRARNTIQLDAPTRYPLLTRDNARIYKTQAHLEEVGIEGLSIGNRQSDLPGLGEEDYTVEGRAGYEVHGAHAILVRQTVNSWIRQVATFQPEDNAGGFHLVSNGILLLQTRGVTVEDCQFENPQYRGGGGNGYAFTLQGNENLLRNLKAVRQRHAYDFKSMAASGNVILHCQSIQPSLASDFHMHLSMTNLLDNLTLDGDYIDATVRPYGTPDYHGVTTSQSVFWNTNGLAYMRNRPYLVNSQQSGWGYVIGTRGVAAAVRTAPLRFTFTSPVASSVDTSPEDHVEGVGQGETLEPRSLYEDQFARRTSRPRQ
jgi:hypothetical protein